jgi:diacylglycerol O-acyltransferase
MPEAAERELRFERQMSDAEAMMWNIEKDPWLSSNIGTVTILDRPLDYELFRRRIAFAVAQIPRMRERVVPGLGRLAPPTWEPDPEFLLDYHVRRLALPEPGSERQLFDLAVLLLQDPLDRNRPLWQFVVVDGLEGGRGALFNKLHHTITDGKGGIRLAEMYMELTREAPPPPEVDLDAITAEAIAERAAERRNATSTSFPGAIRRVAGHTLRRQVGIARRTAGEVALAFADPARVLEAGATLARTARSLGSQIQVGQTAGGSPLWKLRSRHRHFETLTVPFDPAKQAAAALGGSLNDFFVSGAVIGGARYHEKLGADVETFNITFIVSTRDDRSAGGNAFTPSKVQVPAAPMDVRERFAAVRDAMGARRSDISGAGPMGAVAGIANLLPTSLTTRVARSQAGAVDFATSNVRAAPFELYMSGAKVLEPYPIGPVAGTAWNITLMSYNGTLYIGVHVDPVAVTEPDLLRRCLEDGFEELLVAGGSPS